MCEHRKVGGKRPGRSNKISSSNLKISTDNSGFAKKLGNESNVKEQIEITFTEAFPCPKVCFSKKPRARADTKDSENDPRSQEGVGIDLLPEVGWDR